MAAVLHFLCLLLFITETSPTLSVWPDTGLDGRYSFVKDANCTRKMHGLKMLNLVCINCKYEECMDTPSITGHWHTIDHKVELDMMIVILIHDCIGIVYFILINTWISSAFHFLLLSKDNRGTVDVQVIFVVIFAYFNNERMKLECKDNVLIIQQFDLLQILSQIILKHLLLYLNCLISSMDLGVWFYC
eukprot:987833_1